MLLQRLPGFEIASNSVLAACAFWRLTTSALSLTAVVLVSQRPQGLLLVLPPQDLALLLRLGSWCLGFCLCRGSLAGELRKLELPGQLWAQVRPQRSTVVVAGAVGVCPGASVGTSPLLAPLLVQEQSYLRI